MVSLAIPNAVTIGIPAEYRDDRVLANLAVYYPVQLAEHRQLKF